MKQAGFERIELPEPLLNGLVVLVALVLPAALVIVSWQSAIADVEQEARTRFNFHANEIRNAISGRMLDYEQVLRGAAGLFAASESVEKGEWNSYYTSLKIESYYPGIQGIGYAPKVSSGQKGQFESVAKRKIGPSYEMRPSRDSAEYYPIYFLEPPSERNARAIGFDMNSDAVRSSAIREAIVSGRAFLTGKVTLVQETDRNMQSGFLMYMPIYRRGAAIGTSDERVIAAQGVVYAAFRAGNLISRILGDEWQIDVAVYDGTSMAEEALLYRTMLADASSGPPRFSSSMQVLINGVPWTLSMTSTPQFEATVSSDKPRLILVSGFAIQLMLLAVLWSLWSTRSRAVSLARKMTTEVRHREAEWQAMNDASPLGIFRADNEGGYRYVNRRYESLSGLSAAVAVGDGWLAAVHPDDRNRVREAWLAAVAGGASEMTVTYRFLHSAGTVIWVTAGAAAIREENQITGFVGNVEDVTESRRATEALMKGRERLGMALDGSNLALFDWDIRSGEVRLSEQWNLIMGGDKVETVTTVKALNAIVHRDDMPRLQESLDKVLKGHSRFYEVQHRVRNLHGEWRWILSRAKVTERDAEGKALRLVGTNSDITAGKEIERVKNEFIATVSHELRTPLTAIIGSLSLIRETAENLDPEVAGFIDMASQNSERLASLINDVLDIEKIGSGQMTIDLRPQHLRELLEKAVHINMPYAELHNVRLSLLPGDDFDVAADSGRLMQVLTNLISNAAKFSPAQAVVEVSAEARGDAVRVNVRDHGPGIPEKFRGQIFQRFERSDNSNTRRKGGTGLGLAISKALIEHMNGEIGFDSVEGQGSTFYFELPLVRGTAVRPS